MQKLLRNLLKIYILFIIAGISILGLSSVVSQESKFTFRNNEIIDDVLLASFQADSVLKLPVTEPENITTEVEYIPESNDYRITRKAGDIILERRYVPFKEYQDEEMDRLLNSYWKERVKSSNIDDNKGSINLLDKFLPKGFGSGITDAMESVLGAPSIEITPTGSAEIIFSIIHNRRLDPSWEPRQQKTTNFNFEQKIQLGVNAKIGDKINFDLSYNTQAIFNFENKFKLRYEGKEDDILQLMEFGDIQFPLSTNLIQGSQNLFGMHTQLKFGKLTVNALLAEQKSESKNMQIQNGVQTEEFSIKVTDYEENRHFLLAQYFYDHYNEAFEEFPLINSNINITKIEVWRTNIGSAVTENRNIIAFADLGEKNPHFKKYPITDPYGKELPDNYESNNLLVDKNGYGYVNKNNLRNISDASSHLTGLGFVAGEDFVKLESARKLNTNEYTFNPQLGFISLNTPLTSDQVLAVAFQYQIIGDETVYQVGEFSDDGISDPNALIVKLLKSSAVNPELPLWKLMMKNVYFLNSQQVSADNFFLNIMFEGNEGGVPTGYFTEGPQEGVPLIQLLGLDRMDKQQNPFPDGVFDFVDNAASKGGLIESSTGRVYFPYIEPFGKDLRKLLNDDYYASLYCYDSLYTMTKSLAQQYPEQNKYFLEGSYTSALGNEISIGFNVPQGSVKVLAGGIPLVENVDYIVDYMMGKVKIINQGILNSGTPITVTSESNSLFNMTTKRMLGLSANYEFTPNINLGATILNLHERTQLTKNDYGYEPISNTIWGMNFSYQNEVPLITRLVDALPGISTKAPSTFTFNAEFAHFIPGISKTLNSEKGTTYIDAFETAKSSIDLRSVGSWHLASTPQDIKMFPETRPYGSSHRDSVRGREYGFNRARLAWYRIGDAFYRNNVPNISKDDISEPYTRRIYEQEVYPNKELASGERLTIQEFNLAFYPSEKGPYNYDTWPTDVSRGINPDGTLRDPASRWGGVMRKIDNTDFESSNIEYIEFWLMDPFIDKDGHTGGQLVFNLGDISEDILRDGRKSAENGLPTTAQRIGVDSTMWGYVPQNQPIVYAFDNNPEARRYQDVGYDGMGTDDEKIFFSDYLTSLRDISEEAYTQAFDDPSNDNFRFYRSTEWDNTNAKVLERYKYFNNPEGNSPVAEDNNEEYSTSGTTTPNIEDINRDNTLSEAENYYQYVINLQPNEMEIGKNFITNIHVAENIKLANEQTTSCTWYQFKVPIKQPTDVVGSINSFQSIRFMRMFLSGFSEEVVLRFASLELVQGTWRQYTRDLYEPGDYIGGDGANTAFNVATVNIEADGTRIPVPYALPPGVMRERFYSTSSYTQQNEQSLSMTVEDLSDGDARAIYKNVEYDFRYYKNLKMYVHAEKVRELDNPQTGELTLFMRIGSDFTSNYYEYEMPLHYTPWGTSVNDNHIIWPSENEIILDLDQLVEIKESRNKKIRSGSTEYSNTQLYSEYLDDKRVSVLGTPNLGKVKVIMIGVRNPRKRDVNDGDDMEPKSAMVWINELRLTDFNNKGGWAATALARANLADLGNVSIHGAYSSAGFGSIDQQISNLDANNTTTFDFATDLELGKFLPDNWGINIPAHFDHSLMIEAPKYNPLDPDVKLKDDLETYQTKEEKDSIKSLAQNETRRTNINFMNVRKIRTGKSALKPRFYEIENFDFSYSYSKTSYFNSDIEFNNNVQQRGGFNYSFAANPKPFKPFGDIKDKNLKILSDFGLNYQIKMVSFRTELTRDYTESKLRNKGAGLVIMPVTYSKLFNWTRQYNLQYDPTTNFKIQYTSNVNAQIDEPYGKPQSSVVWDGIKKGGRVQDVKQHISFLWDIPINKLPYADWIKTSAGYRATYTYIGPSVSTKSLGGTIESSGLLDLNAGFALTNLYNKIPLLAKANKKKSTAAVQARRPGADLQKEPDPQTVKDSVENARKEQIRKIFIEAGNFGLRILTSVKNINLKYSETNGTFVPGYMLEPKILGMTPGNSWNPGLKFILGIPGSGIMEQLVRDDETMILKNEANGGESSVLSHHKLMNTAYQERLNKTFSGSASLEPIRDMKIEVMFNQTYSDNYSAYYKFDTTLNRVKGPTTPTRGGAYTTTTWLLASSFTKKQGDANEVFNKFMEYRYIIANRLAKENAENINSTPWDQFPNVDSLSDIGFPKGYSASSQQVLLPAMLAAYMGKDPNKIGFSPFLKFPLPNWNLRYTGLSNIEFLKKWFTNISVSHSYSATYTISSYTTDVRVGTGENEYGKETIVNPNSGNFIPKEVIDQVSMQEQFAPLIRVDFSLKNSFLGNFEYRQARTLGFSFANTQLTEVTSKGIVMGMGYSFKDVAFKINTGSGSRDLKSDIVTKLDISWTRNHTVLRRLNQNLNQTSAGSDVFSFSLSGEYALTKKLTAKLFFTTVMNTPAISSSIPTTTIEGGISIRFTL